MAVAPSGACRGTLSKPKNSEFHMGTSCTRHHSMEVRRYANTSCMASSFDALGPVRLGPRVSRSQRESGSSLGVGEASGDRRGIEQYQRVMQPMVLGPRLLATARHFEHQAEQFPAHLFDCRAAVSDPAGVDVHKVVP